MSATCNRFVATFSQDQGKLFAMMLSSPFQSAAIENQNVFP